MTWNWLPASLRLSDLTLLTLKSKLDKPVPTLILLVQLFLAAPSSAVVAALVIVAPNINIQSRQYRVGQKTAPLCIFPEYLDNCQR